MSAHALRRQLSLALLASAPAFSQVTVVRNLSAVFSQDEQVDAALSLAHTGSDGAAFFGRLKEPTGVDEAGFHDRLLGMIQK